MKFIGIIPARYASTRFPGKPLALIGGTTMIERVYRQASKALDDVLVATDDTRIFDAVRAFSGNVVMTSAEHRSGTDRCYEAYLRYGKQADVVINIQGDEPFVRPEQIEAIKACFPAQIATLVKPFTETDTLDDLLNPNTPKVVFSSQSGNALWFSRSVIPYFRGVPQCDWLRNHTFYKHLGMYAYRTDILAQITRLPQSPLEKAESLEQLRWLENGYQIKVAVTGIQSIGIDTPADLIRAEQFLRTHNI
ncbi:MAG: 3-deoxy-manno-octulosonate cytidylyltransferase [Paludibacteraceae bacterium]|nr:3-deoxy-manno-octulosonate cytidylyltransferase [Paludibacteraceae bacterium]